MAEETEKIYVIPLKKKNYVTSIAADTAMKRVKQYLMKHMKVDMADIWIDASLNQEVWKHGKYNMPNKLRVKAVKFDDGIVEVYLPELEFTKSRREILQDEKAKKTPILMKEEEQVGEEGEAGGEDYDVVPAADGDVKIKKKKPEKEKSDEKKVSEKVDVKAKAKKSVEKPKETKSIKKVEKKKEETPAVKKKTDTKKASAAPSKDKKTTTTKKTTSKSKKPSTTKKEEKKPSTASSKVKKKASAKDSKESE